MRAIIRVISVICRPLHRNIHLTSFCCHGTIDEKEVSKFSDLCHNWWNESGDLKALHTLNQLRVPLIRDGLTGGHHLNITSPLSGFSVLDVGCGGGILTESLARLGSNVTGIDASEENIEAAKWHATLDPTVQENTRYIAQPVEDIEDRECFDAVVASEIIEHVADVNQFIESCCDLVKPGGSLFLTTINRTWLSWALAVVAAEKVFKLVPDGSHDWNKFVTDKEISNILQQNAMSISLVHGMLLNPLTLRWQWTEDTSLNYALHAVKDDHHNDQSSDSSSSDSE